MYKKQKTIDNSPKPISEKSAYVKMAKYCAYQERCESEILTQLDKYILSKEEKSRIIERLIDEKFLDEERFVRSYIRGKFTFKKWGRIKIRQHLKMKNIDDLSIRMGLKEIDETAYRKVIYELFDKKNAQEKEQDLYKRKAKIINHLLSKGFESDIVFKIVEECMS